MEQAFFTGGVLVGSVLVCLFLGLLHNNPDSYYTLADNAIKECEYALPRNQRCIITAIPEENQ